eukprot:c5479_g1_i1.p1 GENE.c5479_g1_i1~~c5479_g1_i1.p1  ORF type:complete len:266 (-),score=71.35 c5479_g1_i1:377-1174(-)
MTQQLKLVCSRAINQASFLHVIPPELRPEGFTKVSQSGRLRQRKLFEPFHSWYVRLCNEHHLAIQAITALSSDETDSQITGCLLETSTSLSKEAILHDYFVVEDNTVAVLIVLRCDDEEYVVLTEQPRVAIAQQNFLEIPKGSFAGPNRILLNSRKQLRGLTQIEITPRNTLSLTDFAFSPRYSGVCVAPATSSVRVAILLHVKTVTRAWLREMVSDSLHATSRLVLVPLDDVWRVSADAVTHSALVLLDRLTAEARLPPLLGWS